MKSPCGYMLYSWSRVSIGIIDNSAIFGADAIVYAVLMLFLLKEKINAQQWLGVIIASVGVSYVFLFDFQFTSWVQAVSAGMAGLLSSLSLSVIILMNTVVVQHEPPLRLAFYQCLIGSLLSGILLFIALVTGDPIFNSVPTRELFLSISSGVIYGISLIFFFNAFLYTEPLIISVLGYSLPLFVSFFSWTILNEIISNQDILSAIIITIGGAFVVFSEYRADKNFSKGSNKLLSGKPIYMDTLEEEMHTLRNKYKSGDISYYEYVLQRHEFNKLLFQFSYEIKNTNIEKIEIRKNTVVFSIKPFNIQIACDRGLKPTFITTTQNNRISDMEVQGSAK